MATAAPSSFLKSWKATGKESNHLSGSVTLSVAVQSILPASDCLSRASGVKEVEPPWPLGTAHKASDQWAHRS